MNSLQILEVLTKSSVWCFMCYISGKGIMFKKVSSKKSSHYPSPYIFIWQCRHGTSHLVQTISQVLSKELLYDSKEPDKPRVLLLGPTCISAVNIGGKIIHSGLGIKPGVKLLGLSDKMKTSLRNALSEVKMVIIDEFSMVSSDLFFKINTRLLEILCVPLQLNLLG